MIPEERPSRSDLALEERPFDWTGYARPADAAGMLDRLQRECAASRVAREK